MREWSTFADGSDCLECKSYEKELQETKEKLKLETLEVEHCASEIDKLYQRLKILSDKLKAVEAERDNFQSDLGALTRCDWANSYPQCDEDIDTLCRGCENLKQIKEGK